MKSIIDTKVRYTNLSVKKVFAQLTINRPLHFITKITDPRQTRVRRPNQLLTQTNYFSIFQPTIFIYPYLNQNIPKDNTEIEIRITKAMALLSEQSKPNIAKTTREFAVLFNRTGFVTDGIAVNRSFSDNLTVGNSVLYKSLLYANSSNTLIRLAPR